MRSSHFFKWGTNPLDLTYAVNFPTNFSGEEEFSNIMANVHIHSPHYICQAIVVRLGAEPNFRVNKNPQYGLKNNIKNAACDTIFACVTWWIFKKTWIFKTIREVTKCNRFYLNVRLYITMQLVLQILHLF